MAASSIRFGPGCTREVGMDFKNMGAKKVMVVTDQNVSKLEVMKQVREGLGREAIEFVEFDRTVVEPKDSSIKEAIDFSKPHQPDSFLAVGGGSVIDTAKLMNLYNCFPDAEFLDFVNAPLGKGLPISKPLKPLIAVPTTAGTGSETTGTAIFDLVSKKAKTGIAHRALKPTLGICDPLNTRTMPSAVHSSSVYLLDKVRVLMFSAIRSNLGQQFPITNGCHDLQIPLCALLTKVRQTDHIGDFQLTEYPTGANPISDIFSLQALRSTVQYLPRAVSDPDDFEAQSQMLLAATLAGVGFGNAGVHLCHGMSYPISGQNPGYTHPGYVTNKPIIPHGVSVAVTAPSVFRFTGASNPERHLAAAEAFGVDVSNVSKSSAGEVLGEALAQFLVKLGDQPRGLKALGFSRGHVDGLVEGTLPQKRVLMLAPNLSAEVSEEKEQLRSLFEDAMEY
ncbi:MAG: hypothetical protein M1836_008058 [Candelina mexicana]|nr:MAG: hypothetical protein M1836_008058 [Candelina mexicana]